MHSIENDPTRFFMYADTSLYENILGVQALEVNGQPYRFVDLIASNIQWLNTQDFSINAKKRDGLTLNISNSDGIQSIASVFGIKNPYESNNIVIAKRNATLSKLFNDFKDSQGNAIDIKYSSGKPSSVCFVMGLPSGLDENGVTDDSWRKVALNSNNTLNGQKMFQAYIGKFNSDKTYTPVNVAYEYTKYQVLDPEAEPEEDVLYYDSPTWKIWKNNIGFVEVTPEEIMSNPQFNWVEANPKIKWAETLINFLCDRTFTQDEANLRIWRPSPSSYDWLKKHICPRTKWNAKSYDGMNKYNLDQENLEYFGLNIGVWKGGYHPDPYYITGCTIQNLVTNESFVPRMNPFKSNNLVMD